MPWSRTAGKLSAILASSDHLCLAKAIPVLEQRLPLNFDDFPPCPCWQKHRLWHPQKHSLFFVGEFQPTHLFGNDVSSRRSFSVCGGPLVCCAQDPSGTAVCWAKLNAHRVGCRLLRDTCLQTLGLTFDLLGLLF